MGCYAKILLKVCWKIDHLPYLCDNFYCKVASENRILVLLVIKEL